MHLRLVGLWPGLAPAWYRGEFRGLCLALLFSWVLCLLLLATFVWPAWVSGWLVALGWVLVGAFWLIESCRSQFSLHRLLENVAPDSDDVFSLAQREYLRGNWFEAEAKLLDILDHHPNDVSATLALIGVLRHTKRWRPALHRLEQLQLMDAATLWQFEIHRETALIRQAMSAESESEIEAENKSEAV